VSLGSGRPLNTQATTDLYRTGAYPISARPAGVGRNRNLAQATVHIDARLMKTIRYRDGRIWLQYGVEAFNMVNHTNAVVISEYFVSPRGRVEATGR